MRVLVLLPFLLSASLSSQPVLEGEPTGGQRGLVTVAGVATGFGAVVGTYTVLYPASDQPVGAALVVAAYPLGVAAGVTVVGWALGLEAEFGTAFVDAAISLPVAGAAGLVLGVVVAAAIWVPTAGVDYNFLPAIGGGLTALVVGSTIPAVWATRHVTVRPTVLSGPYGDGGSGLSLRVAL